MHRSDACVSCNGRGAKIANRRIKENKSHKHRAPKRGLLTCSQKLKNSNSHKQQVQHTSGNADQIAISNTWRASDQSASFVRARMAAPVVLGYPRHPRAVRPRQRAGHCSRQLRAVWPPDVGRAVPSGGTACSLPHSHRLCRSKLHDQNVQKNEN